MEIITVITEMSSVNHRFSSSLERRFPQAESAFRAWMNTHQGEVEVGDLSHRGKCFEVRPPTRALNPVHNLVFRGRAGAASVVHLDLQCPILPAGLDPEPIVVILEFDSNPRGPRLIDLDSESGGRCCRL